MRIMNHVLKSFIEKFVVIYFNDIIAYIRKEKKHLDNLFKIFLTLREQKLYVNLKKCYFFLNSFVFLDYVVMKDGINMDPSNESQF